MLDVAIIGGGPVGIFGLFQCGMLELNAGIFESSSQLGGQCIELYADKNIYDIPGFSKISAKNLIENLQEQASKFKHQIFLNTKIIKISQKQEEDKIIFELESHNEKFLAKSVIITVGAGFFIPNKIPLNNAKYFEDKSIFYNVKNKENFQNKTISILGGGDSALDWALEFAQINCKVNLIHRREFTGHNNTINIVKNHKNIKILTPFSINSIEGDEKNGLLQRIYIENLLNKEKICLENDFLFCFFGLTVNNSLLKNSNIENKFNSAIIKNLTTMQTNIDGVFAAGDCSYYEGKLKLILIGFSEISTAIHSAYKFINKKNPHFQHSTTKLSE